MKSCTKRALIRKDSRYETGPGGLLVRKERARGANPPSYRFHMLSTFLRLSGGSVALNRLRNAESLNHVCSCRGNECQLEDVLRRCTIQGGYSIREGQGGCKIREGQGVY